MESRNPLSNIKCRSIQIFNHQIKDNKAIYTIEIKLNNKQSIIITERYSELLNLHNAMSKEAKLPNFPPKKFFGNTDEIFLNQRQLSLNHYYEIITSSHIYSNLASFKSWIFNKFRNVHLEEKEELKYEKYNDINMEKKRQGKIINYINENVIPLFFEYNNIIPNDELVQEILNKEKKDNKEKAYSEIINSKLFPLKENNFVGNNNNFNFIGNKKNNLLKMERLFNNKLNELNEDIKIKCLDKFKSPDILMIFDL